MIQIIKSFNNKTVESEIRAALPSLSHKTVSKNSINLIYIFDQDVYIITLISDKNHKFTFHKYTQITINQFTEKYNKNNFSITNFI